MSDLPPGFELDQGPPQGFTIDPPPSKWRKYMSGVNRSYAALAGLPVDLVNSAMSYRAEGTNYPSLPRAENPLLGGQQFRQGLEAAGVDLNQPRDIWGMLGEYTAPAPFAGAYNAVTAPMRGPMARVATKALGPTLGPLVGQVGREALTGVAAVGGGLVGQQIAEKTGGDPVAWEMAGSLFPSAAATGFSGVPKWMAGARDPAKIAKRTAELDAQGIPLTVGLVTDSPVAKTREAKLAASPGGYEVMRNVGRQADAAFDATHQRIVGGANDSVDSAGSMMRDGTAATGGGIFGRNGWYQRFRAQTQKLYAPVDAAIGSRTKVAAPKTEQFLQQYRAVDPSAPRLSSGEKNPLITSMADDFLSDVNGPGVTTTIGSKTIPGTDPTVDALMNPVKGSPSRVVPVAANSGYTRGWDSLTNSPPTPGTIPYERLKNLRTRVGNALEITDTSVLGSSDRVALKGLYASISKDMESIAETAGVPREFRLANKYYHQGANRAETWLDNLNNKVKPEDFWRATVSDKPQSALQLRTYKQMLTPEEWDYMVETVSNRWGKIAPGQETASHQFALNKWYTNWNSAPEEVRTVLFGKKGTPKRDAAELMAKNVDKYREQAQVLFNSSGSGATGLAASAQYGAIGGAGTAIMGYLTGAVQSLPEAAGAMAVGTFGGVAMATAGSSALAKLTTNQNFARWLSKGMAMPAERLPGHLMRLASIAKNDPELQPVAQEMIKSLDPSLYSQLYGQQH